jgi:hypothetical protein
MIGLLVVYLGKVIECAAREVPLVASLNNP